MMALGIQIAAAVASLFAPVLPQLRTTTVPVLLPAVVPESKDDKLYVAATVSKTKYDVEVALAPDCQTATACHLGDVIGELGSAPTAGKKVTLRDGTPAWFVASQCGASCGDGELTWVRGKYRYTVTIKAGSLASLQAWANAMTPAPSGTSPSSKSM